MHEIDVIRQTRAFLEQDGLLGHHVPTGLQHRVECPLIRSVSMQPDWPFADPPSVASITTRQVTEGGHPILLVTHDADDGCWQALCGTTDDPDDARVVSLGSLYARDPSLGLLADLPLGWRAWRGRAADPWQREPRPGAS